MEIISEHPTASFLIYVVVAVVASLVGVWAFNRLHGWLRHRVVVEEKLRHLREESVRTELSGFLRKNLVVGDADIRQGIVFAPVPPEKLEPLALALGNAVGLLRTLPNLAADVLYVRQKDGSLAMIDLDLDHLIDAARVMQRVAEDRKKSRSLYRGITDEEMKAMIRAGLSQFFKDGGNYEDANAVMAGEYDESREFGMIAAVIDLLFKVKGARND